MPTPGAAIPSGFTNQNVSGHGGLVPFCMEPQLGRLIHASTSDAVKAVRSHATSARSAAMGACHCGWRCRRVIKVNVFSADIADRFSRWTGRCSHHGFVERKARYSGFSRRFWFRLCGAKGLAEEPGSWHRRDREIRRRGVDLSRNDAVSKVSATWKGWRGNEKTSDSSGASWLPHGAQIYLNADTRRGDPNRVHLPES